MADAGLDAPGRSECVASPRSLPAARRRQADPPSPFALLSVEQQLSMAAEAAFDALLLGACAPHRRASVWALLFGSAMRAGAVGLEQLVCRRRLSCPTEAQPCYRSLASPADALLGVVLEVRRQRFVPSLCSDEEAFSADAFASSVAAGGIGVARPAADAFGCSPPALPNEELSCPHCKRAVGAARFAPHLQNCLGKGRNSQRAAKRGAFAAHPATLRLGSGQGTAHPVGGWHCPAACLTRAGWLDADGTRT